MKLNSSLNFNQYLSEAKKLLNPKGFQKLLKNSNRYYKGQICKAPFNAYALNDKTTRLSLIVLRLYIALKAHPHRLPLDKQLRQFRVTKHIRYKSQPARIWDYVTYSHRDLIDNTLTRPDAATELSKLLNNEIIFTEEMVNRIRAAYSDSRQALLGFGGFFLASGIISTAIGAIGLAQVIQMTNSANLGFLIAGIALLTLGAALVGVCHSKTSCPKISVLKNANEENKPATSLTHE